MLYDNLLSETIPMVLEVDMPQTIKGLYSDNVIWLNKNIPTSTEKTCVLAEENGHHYTSSGDILDQNSIANRKQEKRARTWAYEKLVPISSFIEAARLGVRNRHELADHLGVTEEFLESAIIRYIEKYGVQKTFGNYTIRFEPLLVLELFE